MKTQPTKYLKSKEVTSKLKISDCDLMHLRVAEKLSFIKQGNAFLYTEESVLKLTHPKD